jgi:hypothetical protein
MLDQFDDRSKTWHRACNSVEKGWATDDVKKLRVDICLLLRGLKGCDEHSELQSMARKLFKQIHPYDDESDIEDSDDDK